MSPRHPVTTPRFVTHSIVQCYCAPGRNLEFISPEAADSCANRQRLISIRQIHPVAPVVGRQSVIDSFNLPYMVQNHHHWEADASWLAEATLRPGFEVRFPQRVNITTTPKLVCFPEFTPLLSKFSGDPTEDRISPVSFSWCQDHELYMVNTCISSSELASSFVFHLAIFISSPPRKSFPISTS
ncbi:hypothetical protein BDN72DRAFT_496607 [Pluteus cervinus]|uniref:Uncharacterized protein n=1 Tax=Pluteus cervinus TaxID=181527 RepID=A0ACD3AYY6_9AGAR|nr:hypothetical protein BDN72DRAFT_496607 [Pluteus cervinus]